MDGPTVLDLCYDSDDEIAPAAAAPPLVAVEPLAVARRPIQIDDDDDSDDDYRGAKRRRKRRFRLQKSGNIISIGDDDNDPYDRKLPPVSLGKEEKRKKKSRIGATSDAPIEVQKPSTESRKQSALLEVLEVFPDADDSYVGTLLIKHAYQVEFVVSTMMDKGYTRTTKKLAPKAPNEEFVVHKQSNPNERKSKWTYDFLSKDSFAPSKSYKSHSWKLLQSKFNFLNRKGAKEYLRKAKDHYAIAHAAVIDALLSRQEGHQYPSDEAEYADFQKIRRVVLQKRPLDKDERENINSALENAQEFVRKPQLVDRPIITDKILEEEDRYVKEKFSLWKKRMEMFRKRKAAREEAEKENKTIQCNCCFGDYASIEMVKCKDEGHLFCVDCLKQYAKTKIFGVGNLGLDKTTKKPLTELPCMHGDGCTSGFDGDALRKALPESMLAKYDELQLQALITAAGLEGNMVTCPKCEFRAELDESVRVLVCPVAECRFESCRECGEEAHVPLRCDEVEKKHETEGRLRIEEAISNAKIRKCPKRGCGNRFVKESGCNKMTCKCGTMICYLCRADITKEKYQHFCNTPHCDRSKCNKCHLHTNNAEDDAQAMREAGIQESEALQRENGEQGSVRVNVDELLQAGVPEAAPAPRGGNPTVDWARGAGAGLFAQLQGQVPQVRVHPLGARAERVQALEEVNTARANARQLARARRGQMKAERDQARATRAHALVGTETQAVREQAFELDRNTRAQTLIRAQPQREQAQIVREEALAQARTTRAQTLRRIRARREKQQAVRAQPQTQAHRHQEAGAGKPNVVDLL